MIVIEILAKYLKENGYDGLCLPEEECGCWLKDLAPCGDPDRNCIGGHEGIGEDGNHGIFNVAWKEKMKRTCETCSRWVERLDGKDKCGWCPLMEKVTEPDYTCSGHYHIAKEAIDELRKLIFKKKASVTREEVVKMAEEMWEELYGPSILGRVECCCGCVHSTGVESNCWEYYCAVLPCKAGAVKVKGFNVCYEYKKDEMR